MVLDVEEKVDWRACELQKDQELAAVHRLIEMFRPFDFTENETD
jgi:hypothetical protein